MSVCVFCGVPTALYYTGEEKFNVAHFVCVTQYIMILICIRAHVLFQLKLFYSYRISSLYILHAISFSTYTLVCMCTTKRNGRASRLVTFISTKKNNKKKTSRRAVWHRGGGAVILVAFVVCGVAWRRGRRV